MMMKDREIFEHDLHTFADGLVGDEDANQVIGEYLLKHPEEARRVETYRRQNGLVNDLAERASSGDVPDRLLSAFGPPGVRRDHVSGLGKIAIVACLAGAVGLGGGLFLGGRFAPLSGAGKMRSVVQAAPPGDGRPLEIRMNSSVTVPNLTDDGLRYAGARLSEGMDGRRKLHLTYIDSSNRTLRLLVEPRPTSEQQTIQVSHKGATTEVEWASGPLLYKLRSRLPNKEVMAVAATLATGNAMASSLSIHHVGGGSHAFLSGSKTSGLANISRRGSSQSVGTKLDVAATTAIGAKGIEPTPSNAAPRPGHFRESSWKRRQLAVSAARD